MAVLTLAELRKVVDATRDLPGNAVVLLSIPADFPPKPANCGRFEARRLLGTEIRTEDDGTAYSKKQKQWAIVIEGRYDRPPTAPGQTCPSLGKMESQHVSTALAGEAT